MGTPPQHTRARSLAHSPVTPESAIGTGFRPLFNLRSNTTRLSTHDHTHTCGTSNLGQTVLRTTPALITKRSIDFRSYQASLNGFTSDFSAFPQLASIERAARTVDMSLSPRAAQMLIQSSDPAGQMSEPLFHHVSIHGFFFSAGIIPSMRHKRVELGELSSIK